MTIVNPSNAVIAKAKSKYSKRLTHKDYVSLTKCRSIREIIQYLKSYTSYRDFLSKVRFDIHRGNLELILREKVFDDFLGICRYNSAKSPVTEYIINKTEAKEIEHYITLLSAGKPNEYLFSLPTYFLEHTDIDLKRLSQCRDYHSILALFDKTIYHGAFLRHPPDEDKRYDLAAISDDLNVAVLDELFTGVAKIKSKKKRANLIALFNTLTDYENYSRIMRLKRHYQMNNDEVRCHLLPYGFFTGRRLDDIFSHESYDEIRAALDNTVIGRKAGSIREDSETQIKGKFDICRHEMYFSTDPDVILLAYYIVSDTELRNLITIIEGVRYSVQPDSIYEMLIL